ncbi:unnamed protein product [Prorocentrum cordatum]|uniref:Uncharacterized protein n=1 Tax=Prorocentrum cordatum TaxID=2364126 RepID=A0ABN9QEJ7_9DINO|nr:unnamed protein product [Polarella glacialis]
MDEQVRSAWAALPVSEREASMKVCDPEIVGLIDLNMRMLWTAEIQVGVKGEVHPFDRSALPLLSTMLFDGCVEEGQKVYKHVKWPRELAEGPAVVLDIIRDPAGGRAPRPAKPRGRWPELLRPPAKSWVEFERQLAGLLEQLVLSIVGAQPGCNGAFAPVTPAASLEQGPDTDAAVGEDDLEDPDQRPDGQQAQPNASRQAKRQRQRERRKMGKVAARAVAAGEDIPQECIEEGVVPPPALVQAMGVPVAVLDPPADALDTLALTVAQEELELVDTQLTRSCTAPAKISVSMSPTFVASPAEPGSPMTLPAPDPTDEPAKVETAQEKEGLSLSAADEAGGDVVGGRGVGRGRPMGMAAQEPWRGLGGGRAMNAGRGMGRGRTLAPPPGLQGQPVQRGAAQRAPGGLSQAWAPIPEIDDEDEEDAGTPMLASADFWAATGPAGAGPRIPQHRWADASVASVASSYAPTPKATWCPTPSPPMTPVNGAYHMLPPAAFGDGGDGDGGCLGTSGSGACYGMHPCQGMGIPTYVTVPAAMAHTCPHCRQMFGVPPDSDPSQSAAAQDDARDVDLEEMRLLLADRDARIAELERRLLSRRAGGGTGRAAAA